MPSPNGKPLIGITGPQTKALMPRLCVALIVKLYGGEVRQIRPQDTLDLSQFDGFVVTGGHDVDPVLYAAEPEVQPKYDAERDAFEQAVIHAALNSRTPLLGICRGAQLLNVCRGGNLMQELKSRRQITSNRWTVLPVKTLCIRQQTQLQRLLGGAKAPINSLHNQAIDRLGDGLQVSGRDLDGIVQAIEDPGYDFLMGVQWHPEFLLYLRRQRHIFRHLIACARRFQDVRLQARR